MQISNFIKRNILAGLSVLFVSAFLFSQAKMPEMPEMPAMPGLTMPQIDDTFYTPNIPPKNLPQKATSSETDAAEKNRDINQSVLKDGLTTDDIIKRMVSGSDLLTASDISTLYDSNLFSNISSLSGININSQANQNSQTALLEKMLESLDELKAEQKKASAEQKEELAMQKQDKQNFRTREPSVLRFKINGYNIADSLTQVFFSDVEADGSFLLTADRKYFVNQAQINETFYFLFKTSGSNGSVTSYEVIPTIAQDKKNTNSFVYRMCQLSDLTAQKTGNLVVLHYDTGGFIADMLLNIDVK